jgi:hypothetical protein
VTLIGTAARPVSVDTSRLRVLTPAGVRFDIEDEER